MSALRNLCIDPDCLDSVIKSGAMLNILSFIYPWDKVDAADRENLPQEVQGLLAEGATLTTDAAVRIGAATCVLGLCDSEAGCNHLQDLGFKEVLRAWELEEGETSTREMLKKALATLESHNACSTGPKLEA